MIKPTLFVGLGTTGTNILKTLRTLMSEEYKNSGLPVFRYVAIETREAETGDNLAQIEDYERITVVNATIEETSPIRNKLDSRHPNYNSHLTDWLNSSLLNKIQSFRDGASNIRMAGRLCLWENWENVRTTLSNARNEIIEPNNIQNTSNILRQHYEGKNLEVPDRLVNHNGIDVYIVGSLCGGSCSGMFVDMAYFLRSLLTGGANNRIYGVFTMYDRDLASGSGEDIMARAANCYAGLSELNYYSHTETNYNVTFPSRQTFNTAQVPFDYAMFVSPTGRDPIIRFVSGGTVDEDGMNLMVALNLFAEAAGDTDGEKNQIRSDWLAFGGYGGLKQMPIGDDRTLVKYLASFGLTAVWYPKYRIASAAACLAGQRLCENWLKKHVDEERIKTDVLDQWRNIRGNRNILTNPMAEGQPGLRAHIEALLNRANYMFNRQTLSNELNEAMRRFPNEQGGPLSAMFALGGRYFNWIESKVDRCKEALRSTIDEILRDQLIRIELNSTYGLKDVRAFFIEFDRIIEQALRQCPAELPNLNLSALDFKPMDNAKNIWTKIAGKQDEAVKAHRERLIEEYRQLIVGDGGICQRLEDHFFGKVLQDVRAKLGFERHSEDTTIRQQLDRIERNLDQCVQKLREDYESQSEQPRYKCVEIVTNNPRNDIREDANALCSQIANANIETNLFVENGNDITMDVFLKRAPDDITSQVTEAYRHSALNRINEVSDTGDGPESDGLVITKAQEILETTPEKITDLARRSNPYQEFTGAYQPFYLETGTKIIFGHDPTDGHHRLGDLQNRLNFERSGNSSVDHLLFFYEEEASFALDDLAAYQSLKNYFENTHVEYGHWTHRDPNFYDLRLPEKIATLKHWCRALVKLAPLLMGSEVSAFVNVFRVIGEFIFYVYRDESGLVDKQLRLFDDERGIKELCRQENEGAYNNFFDLVKAEFMKFDPEKVNQSVSELTQQVESIDERHNLTDFYSGFLQEIYPDGFVTSEVSPGSTTPTGPSVSGAPPQHTQEAPGKEQSTEFTAEESQRIQLILGKPVDQWTEEDRMLMQRYQQNLGRANSQENLNSEDEYKRKAPTVDKEHPKTG